jgi:hypothetical protein
MIAQEVYLLIGILFLAGKDATSFRLKDHNAYGQLTDKRIVRWHRDGVILWLLLSLPLAYYNSQWWLVMTYSVLIRAATFDPAFNKWAGLKITYLGGSAYFDRLFVRILGKNGALKKTCIVTVVIITLNIIFKSSLI